MPREEFEFPPRKAHGDCVDAHTPLLQQTPLRAALESRSGKLGAAVAIEHSLQGVVEGQMGVR